MSKKWAGRYHWVGVIVALGAGASATPPARAQETDAVSRARSLALEKQRTEALRLLENQLGADPADTDARTLYGIILSWEGRYENARSALELVLESQPTHGDALSALINVELWSNHPDRADRLIDRALRSRPDDTSLLLARVRALTALHRTEDALNAVDNLLELDPAHDQAKRLRQDLKESGGTMKATFTQSYQWFSDDPSGWMETQLSLEQRTRIGVIIARASHAHRSSLDSNLLEIDAYPLLRKGTYAYLNSGWSPDSKLYPGYRLGGELFQNLRHGFEVSGGIRHLGFQDKINVFTGSVSKYHGQYLFTTRTFVTRRRIGDRPSFHLFARRYFGDGFSYVGARFGSGGASVETGSLNELEVLRSRFLATEVKLRIARHCAIEFRLAESREDRINRTGFRHHAVDFTFDLRF